VKRKLYAERPGWGEDFDYDEARHLVAYRYALGLVRDRRVMDAGCGEGFATRVLTETAREVVGMDYHAEAIATAKDKWVRPGLSFRTVDLATAEPDDAFDVVLNFQVIEHVPDALRFAERLHDWVAPGGTLMITTPNAVQSFSENPCHLREYSAVELGTLLRQVFPEVKLLGVFGNERVEAFDRGRRRAVERILKLDPLGLRRLLPERLLHVAFARLGQLVRRVAHRGVGAAPIRIEDFHIGTGDLGRAVDLVALCRRAPVAPEGP
jgi:SAM-dependent methyltransferase